MIDRIPAATVGPVLASGRDATIHAVGRNRVLRRTVDGRSVEGEAAVMTHVLAAGYPVPRVHRVGRGELELDRVEGPTMLADLMAHPWRLARHARTLADLLHRLHRVPVPDDLPPGPVPGDSVLHLDLHPGNVLLGRSGPMVIDWPHASREAAAADVALTWSSLGCFDHDASGLQALLADRFRRTFLDVFLGAAGREAARPLLPAVVGYRLGHPHRGRNVRPGERRAMLDLASASQLPIATHRAATVPPLVRVGEMAEMLAI